MRKLQFTISCLNVRTTIWYRLECDLCNNIRSLRAFKSNLNSFYLQGFWHHLSGKNSVDWGRNTTMPSNRERQSKIVDFFRHVISHERFVSLNAWKIYPENVQIISCGLKKFIVWYFICYYSCCASFMLDILYDNNNTSTPEWDVQGLFI